MIQFVIGFTTGLCRRILVVNRVSCLSALLFLLLSSCAPPILFSPEKVAVGWIEQVSFPEFRSSLDAKLDTGADTSSLHADNIRILVRSSGARLVEFQVEDHSGDYQTLKLPLSRKVKIKTKKGSFQVRPVVTMGVCVGSRYEEVEFTLVDRSHFEYPVLIGRNFLAGKFLVDSSRSFTLPPSCQVGEQD